MKTNDRRTSKKSIRLIAALKMCGLPLLSDSNLYKNSVKSITYTFSTDCSGVFILVNKHKAKYKILDIYKRELSFGYTKIGKNTFQDIVQILEKIENSRINR